MGSSKYSESICLSCCRVEAQDAGGQTTMTKISHISVKVSNLY